MFFTIVIFIIILAVLIITHELGHFMAARAFGIRVDEFGLGFGPRLWSRTFTDKKHGATIYSINAIPFGGFVRIFGETPDDVDDGTHSSRSFVNKPRWAQIIVLAAGIFSNFIFAWLIIAIAFSVGIQVNPDGYPQYQSHISNPQITVTSIAAGSPAEKAGFKIGDVIHEPSIATVQTLVDKSDGKPVMINDTPVTPTKGLIPAGSTNPSGYAIGIGMDFSGRLALPFYLSIWEGLKFTYIIIADTFSVIGSLINQVVHGNHNLLSQVEGPVGIAREVGDAVGVGFSYLLILTALISVNLGVLNLMPFPALDGGRILMVIIEAIIRRPIKPRIANTINAVGFSLLILLMLVVTYHDILNIFTK